jgi:hypothetical protein
MTPKRNNCAWSAQIEGCHEFENKFNLLRFVRPCRLRLEPMRLEAPLAPCQPRHDARHPKVKNRGSKISTEVMVRMSRDQFRSCDMHVGAYIEVRTLDIELKG